jgi:hypothetical protein
MTRFIELILICLNFQNKLSVMLPRWTAKFIIQNGFLSKWTDGVTFFPHLGQLGKCNKLMTKQSKGSMLDI